MHLLQKLCRQVLRRQASAPVRARLYLDLDLDPDPDLNPDLDRLWIWRILFQRR